MSSKESIIHIAQVTKSFGSFQALHNITLDIPKGSFTTFLGPSGCGKTTLMRLIAGFYEPDAGQIFIEGNKVNGIPAFKRNTPLVFQEYALFPHMTVYENISYGLKLRKLPRSEIQAKVDSMLDMFGLQGLEHRHPKQLSGGQQQRVAFARALITGQKILLMDEPLSNLDAKMRVEVRNELRELQQRTGITAIFVTHDQEEALSISDYVAVFSNGRLCQFGTPSEVYFKPNNTFVADFVGTANFAQGEVVGLDNTDLIVKCKEDVIRLHHEGQKVNSGDQVTLVIRPECITVAGTDDVHKVYDNVWSGEIVRHSFMGRLTRYWIQSGDMQWVVDDANPGFRGCMEGRVRMGVDKSSIHLIPAAAG